MNVKLYNTQRCPYARRTRIVLHEKGVAFQKYKPFQAMVSCASLWGHKRGTLRTDSRGLMPRF
jgi:hypothetical protein